MKGEVTEGRRDAELVGILAALAEDQSIVASSPWGDF